MEELIRFLSLYHSDNPGCNARQNRNSRTPNSLRKRMAFSWPWGSLEPMEEEVQPAPPVMQSEVPPPKDRTHPSNVKFLRN